MANISNTVELANVRLVMKILYPGNLGQNGDISQKWIIGDD